MQYLHCRSGRNYAASSGQQVVSAYWLNEPALPWGPWGRRSYIQTLEQNQLD